jgi:hypothetical protein
VVITIWRIGSAGPGEKRKKKYIWSQLTAPYELRAPRMTIADLKICSPTRRPAGVILEEAKLT